MGRESLGAPGADEAAKPGLRAIVRALGGPDMAWLSARFALGAAFLSAVASRFGLWDGTLDLEHFARFQRYAAQVNSFLPASTHSSLAWAATAAELTLGLALVAGVRLRWVALASAGLLMLFGVAMAISFGLKEPLDYSVFSASAAALMLAQGRPPRPSTRSPG